MRVSEIFGSVQGEGLLTGVPSVFIRTSGCNLRCRWCDTPYASWNPEGETMSIAAILDSLRQWPAIRHVVLTGGEPMVAAGIRDLAAELHRENRHITIETAATVPPDGIPCSLASLSPKLAHSTPLPGEIDDAWISRHEASRLRPDVIQQWIDHCPEWQMKFVVAGEADLTEIRGLLAQLGRPLPPDRILLMPEGTTPAALRERSLWLVEQCKSTGFRFCPRLHIDLFGNRRGT